MGYYFHITFTPFDAHSMVDATLECINRELRDCPAETKAKLQWQLMSVEMEYNQWLKDNGFDEQLCYDVCASYPCQNHGKCIVQEPGADSEQLYTCECMEGFDGPNCENRKCFISW